MIQAFTFEKTDGDQIVLLIEDGKVLNSYTQMDFARGTCKINDGKFEVVETVMVPEETITSYEMISGGAA